MQTMICMCIIILSPVVHLVQGFHSDMHTSNRHPNLEPSPGSRKGTENLTHKTLSGHPGHRSSRSGTRAQRFMFLGLGSEDSTHIFDAWSHPTGRLPPHRSGHRPKRCMFMCLFLSWVSRPLLTLVSTAGPHNPCSARLPVHNVRFTNLSLSLSLSLWGGGDFLGFPKPRRFMFLCLFLSRSAEPRRFCRTFGAKPSSSDPAKSSPKGEWDPNPILNFFMGPFSTWNRLENDRKTTRNWLPEGGGM